MTALESEPGTPHSPRLHVRTRPLDSAMPLLAALPASSGSLAWVHGGDGIVGWGEAMRMETNGPDRFTVADRWWRETVERMEIQDDVGMPGTGPVAFTSMAFAGGTEQSVLLVPRIVLGRRNGRGWLTEIVPESGAPAARPPGPVAAPQSPGLLRYSAGRFTEAAFASAVRRATARMRPDGLRKVALAHDVLARAEHEIDIRYVLDGLARRYPECWVFAVDGLTGATPELLIRRAGAAVESRVLAGTAWVQDGETGQPAARLLTSRKDRGEHDLAVGSLAQTLHPFCSELNVPEDPRLLSLRNVVHLATEVRGVLRESADNGSEPEPALPSVLQLAAAVHPTAAVGGTPRGDALAAIDELETMPRGRYAGPVGWVDRHGEGELGIALRCAQIAGSQARLFAGCGIVPESDPKQEVAEADAKMVPVRDALEGVH